MLIGIPKEQNKDQTLVAASPDTVKKLIRLGYSVCVQQGAGEKARFFDEQYEAAGASVVTSTQVWQADIIVCVDTPSDLNISSMKPDSVLLTRLYPHGNEELIKLCSDKGITALALDEVPRLSRAQSLDVRSSMMNVAGYRAVIEAANAFGRTFTGQVTAAGKVPPAKVYVIGVGVAGLAALGQAGAMGAEISATDVRPEVADQVKSLGGKFVEIPVKQESSNGYAQALDDEQQQATLEVYSAQCANNDIVITTAQVPGHPAPLLITEEAVASMKPGSVIVDMGASELGGNCALSKPNEIDVTDNGVTIIGWTNLPARLPGQASQLFGQNIVNFLKLCTPNNDGEMVIDTSDIVVRGMLVTFHGESMWPPPEITVSVSSNNEKSSILDDQNNEQQTKPEKSFLAKHWWKILGGLLAVLLIMVSPASVSGHYIVFMLAVVVGFYVITNVTHTLHTPLMSETNAISGIIIVGAILLIGSNNIVIQILSFIAMVVAAINIFGGFLVTHRMLKMFERSSEDK